MAGAAEQVRAREPKRPFDVAAGPLDRTLAAIAGTAGIAIAWSDLPRGRASPDVRGTLTVEEALRRALKWSGLVANRVGPTAWRVVRRPTTPRPARAEPIVRSSAPRSDLVIADVVVTGHKREQALMRAAGAVSVVRPEDVQPGGLSTATRGVAAEVEGLALTNLGPGRNRPFIRGVADSPFNGGSQSTVAVVLDEARVTFDAPDPDLRLVDMDQLELLKGPQGPLYGSGALGGIYHLVTRKPDPGATGGSVRLAAAAVQHGGPGGSAEAILNLPLIEGRLAIRGVGYVAREAGWIDNIGGRRNANGTAIGGGRLALRWQPDADWTIDLSGILQDVNSRDSQYVTASDEAVTRRVRMREPSDNDFKAAAATVRGRLGGLTILGTVSRVHHTLDTVLDATDAADAFGTTGPTRFVDDRRYRIENYEVRLSPSASSRWVAGLAYLVARSDTMGTISDANADTMVERRSRRVSEIAGFGELNVGLAPSLTAVLGARLSHTLADDEAAEQADGTSRRVNQTILSPSVALTWAASADGFAYARYARALRPGGLAPADIAGARKFDADELGTVDIGYRWRDPAGRFSATVNGFNTIWSDIQSDFLLPNGLVSTRNAGTGRIYGAEASAGLRFGANSLTLGATYVDGRLTRTAAGVEVDDRRLPITPDLAARAELRRRFDLGSWTTLVTAQVNYVGRSRLSFDADLDRTMGGYAVGAIAALATRGPLALGARLDNVLNVRGDSFAFGNPFSIRLGRQFTPLQPRTLTLSLSRAF